MPKNFIDPNLPIPYGTCDCYFLRKLTDTTTGWIYAWTTSKSCAEEIAAALNERAEEGWRNK